jgi:hypothetical protein
MQLSPILLIIIGMILKANPMWFNGAAAVGAFCFWAGVIILVFVLVVWVIVIIAASGNSNRRNRW